MSYSLMIANGDLSFNGADLDIVQGSDKLIQDLVCCVLEPMGTDTMHPEFGSLIEGGTDPSGNSVSGVIGTPNDPHAAAFVSGEIRRICESYQRQQQARYSRDVQTYGKSTITASEALVSVEEVKTNSVQDTLYITARLATGQGSLSMSLPTTSI